jgi:glycosyltransferase involved in cell wall biosynthesis
LLDALELLAHPIRLRFVGDGPRRASLEAHVQERHLADRVEFAGNQPRDRGFEGAHLAVLPSAWEGFPLTVLEAMRAGLPVVATDVGGVREAVEDRETGVLVPRGSVEALRSALDWVLEDPARAQRLGRRGRARFEEHLTTAEMARATWEVLRRVRR